MIANLNTYNTKGLYIPLGSYSILNKDLMFKNIRETFMVCSLNDLTSFGKMNLPSSGMKLID